MHNSQFIIMITDVGDIQSSMFNVQSSMFNVQCSMLKGYNANHKVQISKFKIQSLIVALSPLSAFKLGSL